MTYILQRDDQNATRTLGTLKVGDVVYQTLELPDNGNKPDVSRIPAGTYLCKLQFSPVHNMKLYWLQDVPDRGSVEIHWGNFARDSKGCILLGLSREKDAIDNSVLAFDAFMAQTNGADFYLVIYDPIAPVIVNG